MHRIFLLMVANWCIKYYWRLQCIHVCSWWRNDAQNILEDFNTFICAYGGKMIHRIFLTTSMNSYVLMVANWCTKYSWRLQYIHLCSWWQNDPQNILDDFNEFICANGGKIMHKIFLKTPLHPYVLTVAKWCTGYSWRLQCIHMCSWWQHHAQNILEDSNASICAHAGKFMHRIVLKTSVYPYVLVIANRIHKIFLKTSMR